MSMNRLHISQNMTQAVQETKQLISAARDNEAWHVNSELLSISEPDKRSFDEKEAANSHWFVRELK